MRKLPVGLFRITLISFLLVASACGGSSEEKAPTPAKTTTAPAAVDSGAGGTQVTIMANSNPYVFQPADFTFNAGENYNLVFNVDAELHTFSSEALGVEVVLNPNSTVTHAIKFDTPGTYEFICVPHLAEGMKATVTVK